MMHMIAHAFAIRCIKAGLIAEDDTEWFIYGIEKRLTTLITSSFFLLVGSYLSVPSVTLIYLVSFLFLRSRTNGFHAKTYINCLLLSIVNEVLFLRFLLPLLTVRVVWFLNIVSIFVILLTAPANTTFIHMSQDEIKQTKIFIFNRIVCLTLFLILFRKISFVVQGITLGDTMAAFFLLVEIIKGGMSNARKTYTKNHTDSCAGNDHP